MVLGRHRNVARCLFIAALILLVVSCDKPQSGGGSGKPQVLYLHTEFLPYKQDNDKNLSNRLGREIVRQAVLIAARDGLGLQTCDETLQETPPDDAEVVNLVVTERSHSDGKWHVRLDKFAEGQAASAGRPLWEKTYEFSATPATIYAEMIPKLEADSRGAFVEALKLAGLRGVAREKKSEKAASPADDLTKLLSMPDFVTQFGVVRAAHQAVAVNGETPEWLSVRARGYANLATLTHHQWTSATDVFAARAWLYGQRMVAADRTSSFALWNRAYAWAMVGSFQNALADLAVIEKLPGADDSASKQAEWTKLIKPYASSNRAVVKQLGQDVHELKPWSTYLNFQLSCFARDSDSMYKVANDAGGVCPMAYGAFVEMAQHGQQLGVVRMGAHVAPAAFAHFMPITLGGVPGLPAEIQALLPSDATKAAELEKLANDPNPKDEFSAVPGLFAEKLRERSRTKAEGDLSWSALASLLEEELFVEEALYMHVAMNATEWSQQGEVDSLLPLVKKHRYASFIECFTLGNVRDPVRLFGYFGKMEVRDPRWNMYPMFGRIGYLKNERGEAIGSKLMAEASRGFTLPDEIEYLMPGGSSGIRADLDDAAASANEVSKIAPGSPVGVRALIQATKDPTLKDLETWEKDAADDSVSLTTVGREFFKAGREDDAIRCWEKAIEAQPNSLEATTELAACFRKQGDLKNWETTLVEFLKTESVGLEHSVAQQELALGFAHDGDWKKARPYALAAAQTYSERSLNVGSLIMEGLAEWDISEQMAHASATGYPTNEGAGWFIWCRRTGRGDVKSAEQLADQYFQLPHPHPTEESHMLLGLYQQLKGNLQAARDSYLQALAIKRTFTFTCLVAELSKEIKDEGTEAEVLAAMEKEVAQPVDKTVRTPEVDQAGLLLLDLVKNGNPTAERVSAIEDSLLKIDERHRPSAVAWCYFVGNALEAAVQEKEAEKFWRRALIDPDRQPLLATLAGAKLAAHSGTARPDGDALTAADLWPPMKTK
jgi:tetratricopeptide (TPR) repeat protein